MTSRLLAGAAGLLTCAAVFVACQSSGASPKQGEWRLHGGTAWEQRYSPLTQINAGNVSRLGVAWTFDKFVVRGRTHHGVEATPLVVDGVMYFTGPWSVVYALDARTGRQLWTYDPEVDGGALRKACCDADNRGVAVANGKVYVGSLDGYLIALDARNGKQLWKVDTLIDRSRNYTITGAPALAGGVVVIGNGGGDMGTRGYVTAYDLNTGKQAWRFFIVPGEPAKGPDEGPEVTQARKTWSPQSRWDLGGGGNAWDGMTYDPQTGVLFVGAGNGGPHPAWIRSPGGGDNLFLSSILALDAKTGRLKWHYQTTPGDSWDYTATQNIILADLTVDGKPRKVLMQAPKNGFFYVLDRETGKPIAADAYTTVTWADHVDLATGRPVLTGQGDYSQAPKIVWPAAAGGHNWQPMAFSPQTGLVYIPVLESPLRYINDPTVTYRPGSGVIGHGAQIPPFPEQNLTPKPVFQSVLKAWDPVARKVAWASSPGPYWNAGGIATTAGGLVLQGGADGLFTVRDAKTGRLLKTLDTGTAMMAPPITYSVGGVQYIAVLGGYGGAFGPLYVPGTAPLKYQNAERLMVFKLGGSAPVKPSLSQAPPRQPAPVVTDEDKALAPKGQGLYLANCARCHSYGGPAGNYPDVWNLSPETHAAFEDIVYDGALSYAGMASFADVMSKEDVRAIHAFLKVEQGKAAAPVTEHLAPH